MWLSLEVVSLKMFLQQNVDLPYAVQCILKVPHHRKYFQEKLIY